jgi:hypothetical protein
MLTKVSPRWSDRGTGIINVPETEWIQLKTKFSTSIKGGKIKLPKAFSGKG